jgi:hypothetical protein
LEGNGFGLSIKKRESNGQTRDAGIRSIPPGFSLLTGDGFMQHAGGILQCIAARKSSW